MPVPDVAAEDDLRPYLDAFNADAALLAAVTRTPISLVVSPPGDSSAEAFKTRTSFTSNTTAPGGNQ